MEKPFKDLYPFFRYIQPFRMFYIFTFTSMLIQTILGLVQPMFFKRLIDNVFNAPDPINHLSEFLIIISILLLIRVVSTVLGMVGSVYTTRVTTSATNALEFDVLRKLHLVPMRYHDRHAPGEIFPRLYGDPSQIIGFYMSFVPQMAASLLRMILVFFVVIYHLWWAGLIALLPAIPMWFISRFNIRYFKKISDKQFKKQQDLYMRILDMLHGMKIVKVFKKSNFEMNRFRIIQNEFRQLQIEAAKRSAWMSPLISTIGTLGGGIVFLAGAARLMGLFGFNQSTFSLGTLFMVLSYVWQLSDPITNFANFSSRLGGIRGASERILDLLKEQEIQQEDIGRNRIESDNILDFKDVTFSYDTGRPVLNKVSFSIKPGEKIGLVGPSGSGKTTILNLICGFYNPDSGMIQVGGNVPGHVNSGPPRSPLLSLAMQGGELFQGTIRENLGYGRSDITDDDLDHALEIVEAREFTAALPNGLDTMVGEGSRILSAGQMQRLSLARAIAANAEILIMDEATSWVDLWTEQRIFSRLIQEMKSKTLLCISHRLHLMQMMDQILVLRNGRLINKGTHHELIHSDSFYSSSWSLRDCDGNRD
ncbi:ABC transporter ATP-binding protein [bacterium]|nr:ABC transporter ATP-binding protein [candidate division CSSED10-310 bacterium]